MDGLFNFFGLTMTEVLILAGLGFLLFSPQEIMRLVRKFARWLRSIVQSDFMREILRVSQQIKRMPTEIMRDDAMADLMEETPLVVVQTAPPTPPAAPESSAPPIEPKEWRK